MARLTEASSSNIARYAYSEKARMLYIEFHNGGCYKYDDVTLSEFNAFRNASSLGQRFHSHIKDAKTFEKLDNFSHFVAVSGDRSLVVSEPMMWGEIEIDTVCVL